MKRNLRRCAVHWLWLPVIASLTFGVLRAEPSASGVMLKAIKGAVEFRAQPGPWQPLQSDSQLGEGCVIRTHENSALDFYLNDSKTTLRLTPGSELALETMKCWQAGDLTVTETEVKLLKGTVIGAQKKLLNPSHFEIATRSGVASITGTEYEISADGGVTVLNGTVAMSRNPPGGGRPVNLSVPAGQSFDPATGIVAPTPPQHLQVISTDTTAVSRNAEACLNTASPVADDTRKCVSPVHSHGHNGVGNEPKPHPPGHPPVNDGPGTRPGKPGNKGGPNQ